MNTHDESHLVSAALCKGIFEGLSQRIHTLQSDKSKRWCCFFEPGYKRFAYISHQKRRPRIEIWFLGQVGDPNRYPSLKIKERIPTSGGFGRDFGSRFYLDDGAQLQDAINLLYEVSYATSVASKTYLDKNASAIAPKGRSPKFKGSIQREEKFVEGEKRASVTTSRNSQLRKAAKRKWGLKCYCCGFDFEQFYGTIAQDFAIVHHLDPFMDTSGESRQSSVEDVRVVCANCHYVIHLETPPVDVESLKERISESWHRWSEMGVSRINHSL